MIRKRRSRETRNGNRETSSRGLPGFLAIPLLFPWFLACGSGAASIPSASAVASAPVAAALAVEEGATVEAAVLVHATTESAGVEWENDWIWRHYGKFRKKKVQLAGREGRRFDVVTVELADHSEKVLYFDITDFFGRK